MLQGHPDMKKVPGVDMSTGSLGQGLSAANGMALAAKLDKAPWQVYVMAGDGEIQEGQIWEAAMSAAHYHLDNIMLFVDCNGLQIDGTNDEVMTVNPVSDKFKAFGWNVIEINGHDYEAIRGAIAAGKSVKDKPTAVISHSVKGKGVSFMENQVGWHGKAPSPEQCAQLSSAAIFKGATGRESLNTKLLAMIALLLWNHHLFGNITYDLYHFPLTGSRG